MEAVYINNLTIINVGPVWVDYWRKIFHAGRYRPYVHFVQFQKASIRFDVNT